MAQLTGKKIALFIEQRFNEHEFIYPYYRLQEAGAAVIVAGNMAKEHTGEHGLKAWTEAAFSELDPNRLDGIVIAGGYGPDLMRKNKDCLKLVQALHQQQKTIAFICHAGWVPISAGILKGKKATSTLSIKDDMLNAGCQWEDNPVVIDGNLISSRGPHDLPRFAAAVVNALSGNNAEKQYNVS